MRVVFLPDGWADYLHWASEDPKIAKKVNDLIENLSRTPFQGLGKPEPLKNDRLGWWSRRVTEEHRLVYRVTGVGKDQRVEIAQCRFHY